MYCQPLKLLLLQCLLLSSSANDFICATAGMAPADSSEYRKYAPERQVDIIHLAIDVTPDFKGRSISSQARIRFKPIVKSLEELHLNAEELRIKEAKLDGNAVQYQSTDKDLILYFPTPVQAGSEHEVQVEYDAYPKKGLYFRTAEMGYLPEDEHLFTQGEDIEARHWIPCFDSPNEKFTSEITCHVPEKMTVLSNGHLVSEEPEANGLKRVRWLQDKPHTSYLISLVAGYLKKVEDKYRDIPLAFYTPSSQIQYAESSF